MKAEKFWEEHCYNNTIENILPKGVSAQTCLEILVIHFLGYTPLIEYPGSTTQWNAEVTALLLQKYPEGKIRKVPKKKE